MTDRTHKEGFADALLHWYDRHARSLPWRVPPGAGRRPHPYHVLLSEVMLQQTTVAVVEQRFVAFLQRFPSIEALAAAEEADVMAAWAGLGYYRRARALHACAKAIINNHGTEFPQTEDILKTLPGVGDYTAAAISAIAFGQASVVVDGNIERVVARAARIHDMLPKGKKAIRDAAAALMPTARYGDYAQALMDLGARVCRPKAPDCLLCPVRSFCAVAGTVEAETLPRKAPRKSKRDVHGTMFVIRNSRGELLCEDRPAGGLFGGMLGLPGGGWDGREAFDVRSGLSVGTVEHILTHRRLIIDVVTSEPVQRTMPGRWVRLAEARTAMPTLFVKALEKAISSAGS